MNALFSRKVILTTQASRSQPIITKLIRNSSSRHDNDPEVLEKEKKRNLAGEKHDGEMEHAPGWNEALASDSEAHIKADQVDASTADMQDTTLKNLRSKHGEGSSKDSKGYD